MISRQILAVAAAALCWIAAFGCGPASADNASPAVDGGAALDRTGAAILNAPAVLDLPAAGDAASAGQSLGTNPLWGVPLELVNVTRDRPLFSPTRRPPASAATSRPVKAVAAAGPALAPKPTLSLIGTIEGKSEGLAVFVDTATHNVVRLRMGQGQDGWILRSVSEREVVLGKDDRTEVLQLPAAHWTAK